MTSEPLRLAMIGCGGIARRHAEWLRDEPRAQVVACCDPVAATAESLCREFFPQARVETEFSAVLAGDRLEAVVLCSPTRLHYDQVCLALEAGLHVLCEKPLALERAQVVDLIARRARAGCVLSIAHQRRYKPPYATARRELTERAEVYGPVQQIHVFVCERWQQTIAGTWRDDATVGAGYFGDAGIHQIDIVHFVTDQHARRLLAASDRRGSHVEIATRVLAEMSGGASLAAHFVGNAHHYREDMHFHCRHADLLIRDETLWRAVDNRLELVSELVPEGNPLRAFVDAVLEGSPTVTPAEIALPIHDWTSAVMRSAGASVWVDVGT